MAFSDYWFDKDFHELPLMFYSRWDKELDVSKSSVNIVPAGLKGVDKIKLRDKPIAIAPDFKGEITYEWGAFCFRPLSTDQIKKAKSTYKKHKKFCEAPHTWAGNSPHRNYYNLPTNMRFITIGKRTFLDLRKCNVELKRPDLYISGVKAVLLPTDTKDKASRILKRIRQESRQRQ